MPKYLIERLIPEADKLSATDLQGIAQKSCAVLNDMGPRIQWMQSVVTAEGIYCTYIAPDKETLREHARRGGFPADRILEIAAVIDPTTSEG